MIESEDWVGKVGTEGSELTGSSDPKTTCWASPGL